ncbi:uncharacterized protein RCO7_14724 [Rhynchosporium graminicola]|uniref:Uncharacterized protein n=1 Tax=Rhynchosporium graminicola TaxID=2792576 RepID=A0A1E1KYI5_9HELO|nr:uncharacterized protein RCO7_14724 [Rhynchosporium commune]
MPRGKQAKYPACWRASRVTLCRKQPTEFLDFKTFSIPAIDQYLLIPIARPTLADAPYAKEQGFKFRQFFKVDCPNPRPKPTASGFKRID